MHRNRHGEHSLALFVPNFDGDLAGIALREPVSSDLSGRFGSLALSFIYAVEL